MSVVKINAVSVPAEQQARFEERFRGRAGAVEKTPGFEWFELLRPLEGTDQYLVYTRWSSEEAYRTWQSGQDFDRAHEGGGDTLAPAVGALAPPLVLRGAGVRRAARRVGGRPRNGGYCGGIGPEPGADADPSHSQVGAMTDTLADSRTSARMFAEGVPIAVEDVTGRPDAERAAMLADPGFGRYFTDRMFVARYRAGQGWYDARLTAYAPLQLDPSAATLHYAQSIFEGLKAYAQPDGSVATFRPEANAARFVRGAKRLAMPPVPEDAFIAAVDALVDADRDWVPTGADQTLYIRPYQLATEPFLGVRPAHEYLFLIIASPAGRVLPARRPAGLGLPVGGLLRAQPPAAPASPRRAETTPAGVRRLTPGRRAGLRPGGLAGRSSERQWVEEMGGMNLFFGGTAKAQIMGPRRSPAPCCPASPATRCSRWRPVSASREPRRAGSPSASGKQGVRRAAGS